MFKTFAGLAKHFWPIVAALVFIAFAVLVFKIMQMGGPWDLGGAR